MFELNPDYSKRDYLLPPGCKDLIDVLRLDDEKAKWKNFFDSYWKLIYETARKAGLTAAEAQEVVQELMIRVAKMTPNLGFNPAKGSWPSPPHAGTAFKGWVIRITRWLIIDKLKKRRDGAV